MASELTDLVRRYRGSADNAERQTLAMRLLPLVHERLEQDGRREGLGRADAQDLAQDKALTTTVWLLCGRAETGKEDAYVAAVARYKARDLRRRRGREQGEDELGVPLDRRPAEGDSVEDRLIEDERKRKIAAAIRVCLDKMAPRRREVLLRVYFREEAIEALAAEELSSRLTLGGVADERVVGREQARARNSIDALLKNARAQLRDCVGRQLQRGN